jgi:Tfp pilus assembly protein PilN
VWLVTGLSALLAVIFVVLNLVSWVAGNRTLATQLEQRDRLRVEKAALETELKSQLAEMEEVPWKSLTGRVRATNVVLREHGFSWSRLFDDIERIMPHDARLTLIGPGVGPDGVTLSLVLIARSRDAVLELLENLIDDSSFSEPVPIRETLPDDSETGEYELTLRANYHPPAADS